MGVQTSCFVVRILGNFRICGTADCAHNEGCFAAVFFAPFFSRNPKINTEFGGKALNINDWGSVPSTEDLPVLPTPEKPV